MKRARNRTSEKYILVIKLTGPQKRNYETKRRKRVQQNFNKSLALARAARPKLQAASDKLQASSSKLDKKAVQ